MFGKLTKIFLLVLLPISIGNAEEGNWHIVNYWSEWCAPCRIEIPMFNSLSEELADKNNHAIQDQHKDHLQFQINLHF